MGTAQKIIAQKPYLAWYVADPAGLSDSSAVEHILNNGTWSDVLSLLNGLGINTVANIFTQQQTAPRSNYRPEIKNYFSLFFAHHAS